MDIKKSAAEIVKYVGGEENVSQLTHCLTRLRFMLKDNSKVDMDRLGSVEGVLTAQIKAGQTQVVIGAKVESFYNQIVKDFNASQAKYKVVVQAFPQASYNDAVVAAATAKKLPCILDTDAPIVPNWAYAGYLAELNLPAELTGKQLPSTLGKYKDKLYSIGYYDAALGLFAHKDALTAAGLREPTLDKPWTAEEFNGALPKIKASGNYANVFDLATGDPTTEWWTYGYSPFLQSFGGDLIDRSGFAAPLPV